MTKKKIWSTLVYVIVILLLLVVVFKFVDRVKNGLAWGFEFRISSEFKENKDEFELVAKKIYSIYQNAKNEYGVNNVYIPASNDFDFICYRDENSDVVRFSVDVTDEENAALAKCFEILGSDDSHPFILSAEDDKVLFQRGKYRLVYTPTSWFCPQVYEEGQIVIREGLNWFSVGLAVWVKLV